MSAAAMLDAPRARPAHAEWPALPPTVRLGREEELCLIDEATRPVYAPAVRRAARDRLVTNNLRWAATQAARWARAARARGLEPADLVQLGALGLIDAVDAFDPARKARFITCATWHVQRRIRLGFYNGDLVRIPYNLQPGGSDRRAAEDAAAGHGPKAEAARRRLARAAAAVLSIDGDLAQMLAGPDAAARPEADVLAALDVALGSLPTRYRRALSLRLGLGQDGRPRTLTDVGRRLGVSRERVRQIELSALRLLRRDPALRKAVGR